MRLSGLLGLLLVMAAVSGPARATETCRPMPGAEVIWRSEVRYVLVGELHGTAEAPAAFADLICAAVATGRPVIVALEQTVDGQAALDAYLASDGGAVEEMKVMEALYWQSPMRDGRSSVASLALFRDLRRLRVSGRIEGVQAILDRGDGTPASHEAKMAQRLLAVGARRPDAVVIGLMGNLHAMKGSWTARDGLAYRLAGDLLPAGETVSLNIVHAGGSAWFCSQGGCMARALRAPSDARPRGVHLSRDVPGFDGVLSIGPITASPPALPLDPAS